MAMLGEIVVHGADIRAALDLTSAVPLEAITACFDMFRAANFPVGSKRRIAGLGLVATDAEDER
jgi:hypothetical protein